MVIIRAVRTQPTKKVLILVNFFSVSRAKNRFIVNVEPADLFSFYTLKLMTSS